MISRDMTGRFLVKPGSDVKLNDLPTDLLETGGAEDPARDEVKDRAKESLKESRKRLSDAQELLYANDTRSVLLIFQAMDAAGKDGTIRHVMSGVNPQGCQVFSFKKPSAEELDHTFLWRCMKALPERGRIGIFNRSYYEDVLVVKVHPEMIDRATYGEPDKDFWKHRYDDINNFEKHLARNGTLILKFFLHISKSEQRERLLDRLNEPDKNWKFDIGDLAERAKWKDYRHAYEDALSATSTNHAPWHIIPADRKPVARAIVADIVAGAIEGLGLEYPKVSEEGMKQLEIAKRRLEADDSRD